MAETPKVLLLEDQPLLSLELEDLIRDAALADPFTVSTCAAASSWLEEHSPDVAVLDIAVSDGDSSHVAETLSGRGVPFIVHSARSRSDAFLADVFLKGIWVPKLSEPSEILHALSQCLENATIDAGRVSGIAQPTAGANK
jgi:DNA-binding response OmpR family regulator